MRQSVLGIALLALVAAGGYAVFAANRCGTSACSSSADAAGTSCSSTAGTTACETPRGKVAGHFDLAMSGVCRFACATKIEYDPRDVLAQPGAGLGQLTQCPVSGVVFMVDARRPHVLIAGDEYVMCCDRCATKLQHDPRRYLKA